MKRDKTPHIKPVKISGYRRYRLTFWTADGRHREHYSKRQDADTRLAELADERKKFGEAVQNMSPALRSDAVAAAEILRGTGYTLVEAARQLVKALEKDSASMDLRAAVDRFVRSRDQRADEYRRELAAKMEQFTRFHEGRTVATITADDCQRFLDGIGGTAAATTVVNYRTALSMFFKFALARKWCSFNPATLTVRPQETPATITILTPQEADTVLRSCEPEILPGVALQLFCAIRAAEIARLDWSAVQRNEIAEGRKKRVFWTVTVTAQTSKKRTGRRVVEIPACALTWLDLESKPTGKIWPAKERARDLWTLARVRSGYGPYFTDFQPAKAAQLDKDGKVRADLQPWPENALRRTAISYHLAKTNDLQRVAYQSGNSPAVIQEHYNGVALPQEAAKFYAITR